MQHRRGNRQELFSREEMIDSVSKAIIETIGSAGFTITIDPDSVTAINQETGERFIVRFDADHFYDAVIELARQLGVELEEG